MKALVGAFVILLLTACGGGGTVDLQMDAQPSSTNNNNNGTLKPIQSVWNSGTYSLNLTTAVFGTTSTVTANISILSESCTCQLLLQGDNTSGTANISGCAGSYSNCPALDGADTYTNSIASGLSICQGTSCTSFQ